MFLASAALLLSQGLGVPPGAPAGPTITLELEARPQGTETPWRKHELVLDGRARARWRQEPAKEGTGAEDPLRILYLDGTRVLELRADWDASREREGEALEQELAGFLLWQALLLPERNFEWKVLAGERVAAVPGGCLRAKLGADSKPAELLVESGGGVRGRLHAIEWSAEGGVVRPQSLVLERRGQATLELRAIRLEQGRRYLASFFLPPDKRALAPSNAALDARPTFSELPARVERRIPLEQGSTWPLALAREGELRAEHLRRWPGCPLEDARLFELSADARPAAVLLRLATGPTPPPQGFVRHDAAQGLLLLIGGLTELDAQRLSRLRSERGSRPEIAAPYLRLPPASLPPESSPAGAQVVIVLGPE